MDIGKGDWVEAIQSCDGNDDGPVTVKSGNTYFVHAIEEHSFAFSVTCPSCGERGKTWTLIHLGRSPRDSWHPCLFKPLRKPPEEAKTKEEKVDA